jgi:hypothetical protein
LPTAAADHQTVNAKALARQPARRGGFARASSMSIVWMRLVRDLVGAPGALASIAAAGSKRARPLALKILLGEYLQRSTSSKY